MFARLLLFLLCCLDFVHAIFSPNTKKELVLQIQLCMNLESGIPAHLALQTLACETPTFYAEGSGNFNFISCDDRSDSTIGPTAWTNGTGACPGSPMGAMSQWDVSKIENMYGLFKNAESFNADISEWQVRNCFLFLFFYYEPRKLKVSVDAV